MSDQTSTLDYAPASRKHGLKLSIIPIVIIAALGLLLLELLRLF